MSILMGVAESGPARTGGGAIEPDETPINLAAIDNGDNTITFKWDFSASTLLSNATFVGWGSSTMHGQGADTAVLDANGQILTAYKLGDLLSVWVRDNVNLGTYRQVSMNGLYSARFLTDGSSDADHFRNIDAILGYNPQVVILSLPSNDIAETVDNTTFINNLIAIDNALKARNIFMFVTTTQPRDAYTQAQQQRLYDAVALIKGQFGIRAIDVFTETAQPYTTAFPAKIKTQYAAGDSIHLNNSGHAYVANQIIAAMMLYFQNRTYTKYVLERSTTPGSGYSVFIDNLTTLSTTVSRTDSTTYYYRIRALKTTGTFTDYSPEVSLQQPLYAGAILETIRVNCGLSTHIVGASGWNDFIPSGDIANTGEELLALVNTLNVPTAVGMEITNTYPLNGTNGKYVAATSIYPQVASESYWGSNRTSSIGLTPENPSFKFKGLDNSFAYTVKIFPSRAGFGIDRFVVAHSQDKHGLLNAMNAAGGNTNEVITLRGLRPSSGEILIYLKGVGSGNVFQNVVVLEKHSNSDVVTFDAPVANADSRVFGVNNVPGTSNIVKINFTGPGFPSGLSDWNDVDIQSGIVFPLNNSVGSPDSLTISANFIAAATQDNGAAYVFTDTYPASVLRTNRFRTSGYRLTLGGCDPNSTYEIQIIASRANSGTLATRFTINGVAKSMLVNNNVNDASFSNLVPDATGKIFIDIQNDAGTGSGYLTAMIAKRFTTSNAVTFDAPLANADSRVPNVIDSGPITFDAPLANADSRVFGVADSGPVKFDAPLANARSYVFNVTSPGDNTPATYTSGHIYRSPYEAKVLEPIGFNNPGSTDQFPMFISLHGSGQRGTNIDLVDGDGYPQFLSGGDRPPALIIVPQIPTTVNAWSATIIMAAYKYMRDRYPGRIRLDKVYVLGYSLGAIGAFLGMQGTTYAAYGPNKDLFAGMMPLAPAVANTFDYTLLRNMLVWVQAGSADANAQTNPNNTPKVMQSMVALSPPSRVPVRGNWYFAATHNIWDQQYNRYNRTNSLGVRIGGSCRYDFIEYMIGKFSTDQLIQATDHVTWAETTHAYTEQWVDYIEALKLVNDLAGSSQKTALLTRLTTLYNAMGGRRWLIDLGESANQTSPNANNLINSATGQSLLNLVRDDGSSSTIGFTVVTAFGTDTDGVNLDTYYNAPNFGLPNNMNRDAMEVLTTITTGQVKFTGLDNAKKYEVLFFHGSGQLNAGSTAEAKLQVVIGSVTKVQYSEFNSFDFIRFGRAKGTLTFTGSGLTNSPGIQNGNQNQSITPVLGEIVIGISAPGTRKTTLQSIVLFEIP